MPEETPDRRGSFDLERLRELIEMMEKHDVREVRLRHGEERWLVRRGPQEVAAPSMPPPGYPAAPPPPAPVPAEEPPAEKPEEGLLIKSPTVGTFYAAPSPDDPPFVSVGSRVEADTVVCIVEAMKVFNQIPAEVSGTITEILVENGEPVEFGQPLFRVKP